MQIMLLGIFTKALLPKSGLAPCMMIFGKGFLLNAATLKSAGIAAKDYKCCFSLIRSVLNVYTVKQILKFVLLLHHGKQRRII
jgi:hypothetical protein